MSSKNNNIKKDQKISSVVEVKEKDHSLTLCYIIIIILLILVIMCLLFNKKNDDVNCNNSNENEEVIKEPDYQLINYQGFRFQMPLNWNFVSDSNIYSIANTEETLFITLDYIDVSFDEFKEESYIDAFLEEVQTTSNTKIEQYKLINNYYLFEGMNNDYNYVIIAVGNSERVILVKTQFINKSSYLKLKKSVIDFALTIN